MKENRQLNIRMETLESNCRFRHFILQKMLQVLMQLASRVVLHAMASY